MAIHGGEKAKNHVRYSAQCLILFDFGQEFSLRCIPNVCVSILYTTLPKVLGHPLLMKGLTTLVISMSSNLNV